MLGCDEANASPDESFRSVKRRKWLRFGRGRNDLALMNDFARAPLKAILGPTNTGKTHLAVERMCGHSRGMIGFPLRLLAREVYDRVVKAQGREPGRADHRRGEDPARHRRAGSCAPPNPCLPMERRDFAFVALDEAQLGADPERGHVFTDRMLHARGREETMILGSESLAPMVRSAAAQGRDHRPAALLDAELCRPRQAVAAAAALGDRRLLGRAGLRGRRDAAPDARRRGGGDGRAFARAPATPRSRCTRPARSTISSPPTRSAWASTWTSAMSPSPASPSSTAIAAGGSRIAEMAQIAGRAGRHQRDGTFGSLTLEGDALAEFRPEEIEAIEEHRFAPLDFLYWREGEPDFDSVEALIRVARAAAEPARACAPRPRRSTWPSSSGWPTIPWCWRGPRADRCPAALGGLRPARFPQDRARASCPAGRAHLQPSQRGRRPYPARLVCRPRSPGSTMSRATSRRWPTGSPGCAPGPISPTAPTGWPSRRRWPSGRWRSRRSCPTRCTSG